MDIISKRYWYFAISLVVIIPGIISLALWRLPLSIDFTGGSKLEVQFPQAAPGEIQPGDIKTLMADLASATALCKRQRTTSSSSAP
ncbi:MAG: hypothetical protein AAB217_01420 [Chloroflexota bacterium]